MPFGFAVNFKLVYQHIYIYIAVFWQNCSLDNCMRSIQTYDCKNLARKQTMFFILRAFQQSKYSCFDNAVVYHGLQVCFVSSSVTNIQY